MIRPASYSTYPENYFPPGDKSDHGVTLTTHLDHRVTRLRVTGAVKHYIRSWRGQGNPLLLTFLWRWRQQQTSPPTTVYPPPHNLKMSRTSTQSSLHTISPERPFQNLRQSSSDLMKTRVKVLTSKTSWAVCKYSRSIASWIARHSRRGSSNWVHSASKWVRLYLPVFG